MATMKFGFEKLRQWISTWHSREKFPWLPITILCVSKTLSNIISWRSTKKLGSDDASILRKRRKSKFFWIFDFSDPDFMVAMRSGKPLWESAKQLYADVENFPDVLEQCSGYLKHSQTSYNYARKKLIVMRSANQKISTKTWLLLTQKRFKPSSIQT